MTRFFALLAVAAVAGAMYVAAAPGGLRASGPTAAQFSALKKQVTKLQKELTQVKKLATDADGFVHSCLIAGGVSPVSQFGDATNSTYGYVYTASQGAAQTYTTAINLDSSANPQAFFQDVASSCVTSSALRHGAARASGHWVARAEHLK